jgi:hypothetical protein
MNKHEKYAYEGISLLKKIRDQIDPADLNDWSHSDIEDWKIDLP